LKFGQTAPAVPREISVQTLRQLITSDKDLKVFEDTVDRCAVDGKFTGPMIGWWKNLIPIRTVRKKLEGKDGRTPEKERKILQENLLATQMQSKFHSLYFLVNILRHGKDEFITSSGDLISLDLDRSRFRSTPAVSNSHFNYTWCYTCYLDRWVYETFQAVGPDNPRTVRLGTLMQNVLQHETIFPRLWNERMSITLDTRIKMILECTDKCIQEYGEDQVLLHEPHDISPKNVVEWFVTHSEYKSHNGKDGPVDLSFLDQLPG